MIEIGAVPGTRIFLCLDPGLRSKEGCVLSYLLPCLWCWNKQSAMGAQHSASSRDGSQAIEGMKPQPIAAAPQRRRL